MTSATSSPRQSVFYWVNDYWACGWYRCYVPGVALKKLGYRVVLDETIKDADVESSDVIVVQQPSQSQQLDIIRAANEAGKLSVVELDDDVWNLAPSNPSHVYWNRPEVKFHARACVEEAQLITTPTRVLADKLRVMNPKVRVLPNMLPTESWEYLEPKLQREDHVVLGWAGSTSHLEDLKIIEHLVPTLLGRYPHIEFVFVGGHTAGFELEHDRVRRLEPTDIRHYPTLIEQFDIGLIPLTDSPFNRAKSDLKFIEYGRIGIPSVASKLEPYLHTIKHGENGFLATSPKDWLKALTRLIEDVEQRRRIGAAAFDVALTRNIDGAIEKWERAYGLTPPSR